METQRIKLVLDGAFQWGEPFGTLKRRMEQFTLSHLLQVIFEAFDTGISIFNLIKPKIPNDSS